MSVTASNLTLGGGGPATLAALAAWVDRRATPEELAAAGLPQR